MFLVVKKKYTALIFVITVLMLALMMMAVIYCLLIKSHLSGLYNPDENNDGLLIMIYIEEKKLYLFDGSRCIKSYPIASGKQESPSPIGKWEVIEKNDWGEGFGGYWLGLNVLWGKYGIHGTSRESSIGHAASHGCIRLYNKDIKELYDIVTIGTPVIINNGPFGPFGTGFRQLIPGDRGADVLVIQQRLRELGYYKGQENGIYEDDLKLAVYEFQKDNKLKIKYTITYDDYLAMGFKDLE
ncbi:MAG TPA: hypothetical protein DEB10_04450 [Ruminococcaceae bacterium]|jgi:hypothetical protein|nr:hypothetical protein [Oscillospiraceae bacterium]